jgi:hypothetical protein
MQNVERVDFRRIRPPDAEAQRAAANLPLRLERISALRTFESAIPAMGRPRPQNHRGGDHRARQRPAPRFIHPAICVTSRHRRATGR